LRSNPTIHLLLIPILHILHIHIPASLLQCALTRSNQQQQKSGALASSSANPAPFNKGAMRIWRVCDSASAAAARGHAFAKPSMSSMPAALCPLSRDAALGRGLYSVAAKPRSRRPTSETPREGQRLNSRPLQRSCFPPVPVGPRESLSGLGHQCLLSSVIDHDLSTAPDLRSITHSDVPTQPRRKEERETLSSSFTGLLLVWSNARRCST
jgi:hypothetical protein